MKGKSADIFSPDLIFAQYHSNCFHSIGVIGREMCKQSTNGLCRRPSCRKVATSSIRADSYYNFSVCRPCGRAKGRLSTASVCAACSTHSIARSLAAAANANAIVWNASYRADLARPRSRDFCICEREMHREREERSMQSRDRGPLLFAICLRRLVGCCVKSGNPICLRIDSELVRSAFVCLLLPICCLSHLKKTEE
jgi:hypothetical protein